MLEAEATEKLGLEPGQIETLKQAVQKLEQQEEKLRETLQAAGKEQAELLRAEGEVDEAALMKAIEKTGQIRTEMAKLRIQPILLVKKTLTPEQLHMSRRMMHERMQKRRKDMGRRDGRDGRDGDREGKPEARRKHRKDREEPGELDEE
jgi:outer membrane murein-binding lipoprotein Lpp